MAMQGERFDRGQHVGYAVPLATFIFGVALFVRTPNLFLAPRLWAEEGSVYLNSIQNVGLIRGFEFVTNSNYQFLTNAIMSATLFFPVRLTAYISTYISFLISIMMFYFVAVFLKSRGNRLYVLVAASILISFQISGFEVYLSATNAQWICSLCTLMIIVLDDVEASSLSGLMRYALTCIFGLTGVTSGVLLPTALLALALRPSRYRMILTATLALTTAIQLGIVATHPINESRHLHFSAAYIVSFTLQTIVTFVEPIRAVDAIGEVARGTTVPAFGLRVQLIIMGLLVWSAITYWAVRRLGIFAGSILIMGAVSASLVNLYGSLGEIEGQFSGWAGGRYLFLAQAVIVIIITSGLEDCSAMRVWVARILVVLALSNSLITVWSYRPIITSTTWPSFASQVDQCQPRQPCPVSGWPISPEWSFTIPPSRMMINLH